MTSGIMLVLLALVAASPLAYSKSASLWGKGVFPDDREWISPYRRRIFDKLESEADAKNYKVCETSECKKVGDEFLSSMNKSANPCEDFYEFSCGNWSAKDIIPPGYPSWSRFQIFQNLVQHRIKRVLEIPPEPTDILPVKQAKKWYRSCMDTETLQQRGLKPIESIMMQAGGWPISMDEEEWNSEEYTWQKVERHYARLTGSHALYKIGVTSYHRSAFGSVEIEGPTMTLSEHLPLKYRNYTGKNYDVYVDLVEAAANLFVQHNQAKVSKERLRKEAKEIVEFERELFELTEKGYEYGEMMLEYFLEWYNNNMTEINSDPKAKIDWKSVIQDLFNMVNINVDHLAQITWTQTPYILGIGKLLKETPARTIVNYVHWTFVGNMLMYTDKVLRDELLEFNAKEFGIKGQLPRWAECVDDMKMVHAASYVFVNKFFTESIEKDAVVMIKNVQIEMEEKIKNSNWLDEESKKIAKDKLNNMKIFFGFPDWYKNKTAILNYYKGLTVGADYFDNILSFMRYTKKKELRKFAAGEEKQDPWQMDPITVNALYGPFENTINMPAVNFQAPLFTPKLPDAVNYGITGVTIGHEIGHGFDDSGIRFGVNGDRTDLSKKILKSYYQRADCFTDQFDDYFGYTETQKSDETTPEYQYNKMKMSLITRGENIADTTGIQAVFQAYRKIKKHGDDLRLPGLEEFNEDQLFFISFAATWCEVETPEYKAKLIEMHDVHSPAKMRVIGSVSNTKDFARVFSCPEGSAMNPSNKCNIWEKAESANKENSALRGKHNYPWATQWRF